MKKIPFLTILLMINMPLANAVSTSEDVIKVEATLYYLPSEQTEKIKQLSDFQLFPGFLSEFRSMKNEYFDHLQPGGEWHLELQMSDDDQLNIMFSREYKGEPLINKNINLRSMTVSSHELLAFETGTISLNVHPKVHQGLPDAIPITADSFGLDHMCFNNSAVILDHSFYLGKYTGFGERLVVGVPELNRVELSMKPLKDWQPIGTYLNGTINIGLEDNHLLTLLRVGIGPSGFEKGGPFTVYGKIIPETRSKAEVLEDAVSTINREYAGPAWVQYKDNLIEAKKMNPYVNNSAGTIASNSLPSKQLGDVIGSIHTGLKCGSMR